MGPDCAETGGCSFLCSIRGYGFHIRVLVLLREKVMHLARDLNLLTIPDFIEERYESKNARLLASIILIVFAVPLMVSQYKAAGLLFNMVTGIPYEAAVIGFVLVFFM